MMTLLRLASLIVLSHAATAATRSRVIFKSKVKTILTNVESALSAEESTFFAKTWVDEFNIVFSANNVNVSSSDVSSQTHRRPIKHGAPSNGILVTHSDVSGGSIRRGGDLKEMLSQDHLHLPALIRNFEVSLCQSLRACPFESFNSIENCIVSLSAPTPLGHQKRHLRAFTSNEVFSEVVETILSGLHSTMGPREINYYDDMWKETFNELNNPKQAHVDQVDVQQQVLYEDDTQHNRGLQRTNSGHSSIIYYTRIYGSCRNCVHDRHGIRNDIHSRNLLSSAIATRARNLETHPAVALRQFELNLCGKLRFGPLPYFHDVQDCIVDI